MGLSWEKVAEMSLQIYHRFLTGLVEVQVCVNSSAVISQYFVADSFLQGAIFANI